MDPRGDAPKGGLYDRKELVLGRTFDDVLVL